MPSRGYRIHELTQLPEVSGIYAWYYRIDLSKKDIEVCIESCKAAESDDRRNAIIRTFLDTRLFRYYKEQAYDVLLTGALKPTYSGSVENSAAISASLVSRIVTQPERLWRLKQLLLEAVPLFASPIYIGMAKRLKTRLLQHKTLMERYQQALATETLPVVAEASVEEDPELQRDHSFARDVIVSRRLVAHDLLVHVLEIPTDEEARVDIENLLNRINYPLCGRN